MKQWNEEKLHRKIDECLGNLERRLKCVCVYVCERE